MSSFKSLSAHVSLLLKLPHFLAINKELSALSTVTF
jgi:hypothetical protein